MLNGDRGRLGPIPSSLGSLGRGAGPRDPGAAYHWLKRLLDLTATLGSLPLWLPILGIACLAIKLSELGAPVLFSQERTGRGGHRFRMYKLRTMVVEAESQKQQLAESNERAWPDFKITGDPRVTRVGRWLRRSSIDELPQLFNVLLGHMSLVGPRPTSFTAETYELWHTQRLTVKPGLTGLWQVHGRGKTEFNERLRLDIAYIESRSFARDLLLIWQTFKVVLSGRGAD